MSRIKKISVAVLSVAAAVFSVAAFMAVRYYVDNKVSNFTKAYVLYVDEGMDGQAVLDSIVRNAGVIRPGSLERMAAKEGLDASMKEGRYEIKPGMSSVYVIRMIVNNWQTEARLTISGYIRDKGRLAAVLARPLQIDSADIAPLLYDDGFLSEFGFDSETVLGMILPDTYHIFWTASPEEVIRRLGTEYGRFWDERRRSEAAAIGLTPLEVSTLASIIMEESNVVDEYPVIAGVYLNRLHKGMKLQADPTARFASGDFTLTRVLKSHTRIDSPYNTYMYHGLPPAPINVASKAAIEGVLHAQKHDYLYFCARPEFDGRHNFAATYSEHLRNAAAYRKAYKEWLSSRSEAV